MVEAELEKCPVCASDRYLNPNMKFLVNPECYHKMCESCVSRIFTLGPAPCPICSKTLRRNKFRQQTFSDAVIEREVDTRRRLNRIYNKTEEDFDNLRAYNDYLEQVEMITFNLTQGVDVAETEKQVKAYQYANKQSISTNTSREKAEAALAMEASKYEKEAKAEAARQALHLQEQEVLDEAESRQELLSAMAAGADVEAVVRETQENAKRRLENRKRDADARAANAQAQLRHFQKTKGRLQQLKQQADTPFSPMLGMGQPTDLYHVQGDYEDLTLTALKRDKTFSGGGARVHDIYERALFEAFAGLMLPISGDE